MINNTDDLLPLGAASPVPKQDSLGVFGAQVVDTFDSVELLLAARAEAAEAVRPETARLARAVSDALPRPVPADFPLPQMLPTAIRPPPSWAAEI